MIKPEAEARSSIATTVGASEHGFWLAIAIVATIMVFASVSMLLNLFLNSLW